jgi:glycerol uptake facilitator-like aquaporin
MYVIAEFLGTFLLVLSVLVSGSNPIVVGFTLGFIMLLTYKTSGGHINPVISVVRYLQGNLTLSECISYQIAQLSGGIVSYFAYTHLK